MTDYNVVGAARTIATALGADWYATPGHYSVTQDAFLVGPDGLKIHIETTSRPPSTATRLYLAGWFDNAIHERPYNAPQHQISVARAKTPEQIAADIRRRLLPDYRVALTDAVERKVRTNEQNAARDQLAASLAAALDTTVLPRARGSDDGRRDISIRRFGHGLNGDVEVSSATSHVRFTLHVPPAVAVELATAISAVRAKAGDHDD